MGQPECGGEAEQDVRQVPKRMPMTQAWQGAGQKYETLFRHTDLGGAAQQVGVEGEEHLEGALRPHGLAALGQQLRAVHQPQARHQAAELRHHCWQAH